MGVKWTFGGIVHDRFRDDRIGNLCKEKVLNTWGSAGRSTTLQKKNGTKSRKV